MASDMTAVVAEDFFSTLWLQTLPQVTHVEENKSFWCFSHLTL
jgi:hypothetical protein